MLASLKSSEIVFMKVWAEVDPPLLNPALLGKGVVLPIGSGFQKSLMANTKS
jgi:hypothetical protein